MNLVIALGGNALLNPNRKSSYRAYEKTVNSTCRELARIIKEGHKGSGVQIWHAVFQASLIWAGINQKV
ncbi:MAG: hypothetical protein HYX24_01875 [Candidatus Aenigmarchaeota archaeon]|nr:hypothetical protein [Candidatus Aenigmarchaeota archaeon]